MSQQVRFFMEITSSLMSILVPTFFIVYQLHIDVRIHCLNMNWNEISERKKLLACSQDVQIWEVQGTCTFICCKLLLKQLPVILVPYVYEYGLNKDMDSMKWKLIIFICGLN